MIICSCALSLSLLAVGTVSSIEEAKLLATDGQNGDELGQAIAISGNRVVVGAPREDALGGDAGAVYVFMRSGTVWAQEAKITIGAAGGDRFGTSVDISGTTLVVGAPFDDDDGSSSGSAFVFTRSGTVWSLEQKITAGDAASGDEFGFSVAIDGDTIAVGAHRDDDTAMDSGSAYVFVRSLGVWTEDDKLVASDAGLIDNFGNAVDVHEDTVAVGAWHANNTESDAGSVYVFVEMVAGVWTEQIELIATIPELGAFLGISVSLYDQTLVAGATGSTDNGALSGSVYVWTRLAGVWTEDQKVLASDGGFGAQFGESVDLEENKLIVGAIGEDNPTSSGAAYVFLRQFGVFSEGVKLEASDAALSDELGHSVGVSGNTFVSGAPLEDENGASAGAAYVFIVPEVPISYCSGKMTSAGCVPFITANGTASVSSTNPFSIRGFDHVDGEAGLLVYGFKRANLGFHGGKLCVKSPQIRTTAKFAKTINAIDCTTALTVGRLSRNFNQVIQSGVAPQLTVGAQVNAQWLQRDPSNTIGGFGDNLTNGLEFFIGP